MATPTKEEAEAMLRRALEDLERALPAFNETCSSCTACGSARFASWQDHKNAENIRAARDRVHRVLGSMKG